jgi:hypothetical protein
MATYAQLAIHEVPVPSNVAGSVDQDVAGARHTRILFVATTMNGVVASAAMSASIGNPQASTITPDSAPADAPASPMVRSERP